MEKRQTPMEKMTELTRRLVSVPKAEVVKVKKKRGRKRQGK
jgi:hypothetical protein